ncbi:hypothetical protein [Bradyrhizobium japonicum]|nr:hypothetical protein [Bradyrhizobium japonicum]
MSMSSESSAAAARAWEAYTMINPTAKDGDLRHAALTRFVEERSAADGLSAEALAVEGVKFLKRLEVG